MSIHRLQIQSFRNLKKVDLEPSPHINILYGHNGAGKTSILEAIYFLTHGRSYKSSKSKSMVNVEADSAVVFGKVGVNQVPIGLQRFGDGTTDIRIAGETIKAVAELAALVPVQFINAESFLILEGSPKHRRQFLDWGVFHVEHSFIHQWRNAQRALKNRNTLLRSGRMTDQELQSWTTEFVSYSNMVHAARESYLNSFKEEFSKINSQLSGIDGIQLNYQRGWDKAKTLDEVLADSLIRDKKSGFTHSGPQRADLSARYNKHPVADILSRGQQKLVVSAMKLAQGFHLKNAKQEKKCIYLLDDLPAELDQHHLRKVCQLLEQLDAQVFISCIDAGVFEDCWQKPENVKVFHVEHGGLSQE